MVDEINEPVTEEVVKKSKEGISGIGLEPNIAAMLSYLLFLGIGGVIFFLIEKENKFVRFAAIQSVIFNVIALAVWIFLQVLNGLFPLVAGGLLLFLSIIYLIIWILLMIRAYNNEVWELPIIGGIARNIVTK